MAFQEDFGLCSICGENDCECFTASPHDKFWDLLEVADDDKTLKRVCPKCGDSDCKYGLHDRANSKCDVSILCNKCRHSEEANSPNYDAIINNWHKPVQSLD